jgi:hypothetical protein
VRSTIADARCSTQIVSLPSCHAWPIWRSGGTSTAWMRSTSRCPLLDQAATIARTVGLVTLDQRRVHALGLPLDPARLGGLGLAGVRRRSSTSSTSRRVTGSGRHQPGRQPAGAHPPVRGLVVDAERVGRRLQLEIVVGGRHHVGRP